MGGLTKLSEIKSRRIAAMVDYLLDNGFEGFVNDLTPPPNVEYYLDDLLTLDREFW